MTNHVPPGSVHDRAPWTLRWLAAVFLVLAAVNAVLAVCDAVTWPLAMAVGFTTLALYLERRVSSHVR